MATIDQQFVEYIVKTLVNNPDKVVVERKIDEKGVLLTLTVDPEDVGRIIGKRGVTAQAIRVLLRALGTKQDARYNLKIVSTGEGDVEVGREEEGSNGDDRGHHVAEDAKDEGSEDDLDDVLDDDESSELAEKTRAELADLDDLDI
ncbi:KH domain-containing protein [Candidatus Saccharibacteria bacterium]|nr:KH domain-containing protein [Candidatus Saccharibacteria bacterium]